MPGSSSPENVPVIDDLRRTQNRLAQRRHRQKKALQKRATIEQVSGVHPRMNHVLQDYAELSQPTGTLNISPFGSVLPFAASDITMWGGDFQPWEDSISALAGSYPSVSPVSDLLEPANLSQLASILNNLETPEAVRSTAMDVWRTAAPCPNPVFSNDRNEPLVHTAARGNDVASLQILAQHGFSLNERDGDGRTALHVAYEENRMEAILWLLEHGADVNVVDSKGRSTLSMAVNNKCPLGVKLMLTHGATARQAS